MKLGSRLKASTRSRLCGRGAHTAVGDGLQLLQRQAEGHRLEGGQVMHHELAPLCQHHDGTGVVKLIDGGLGRDQGPALHSPEPGNAVGLEAGACLRLHAPTTTLG